MMMKIQERRRHSHQAIDALARGISENRVKPRGVRSLEDQRLKSKNSCAGLHIVQLSRRGRSQVMQDGYPLERRKCFLQEFEAFALQMRIRHRQASQVLTRVRQAFDDTVANRIAIDCEHDGGLDVGRNKRTHRPSASSDDYIEIASRQLTRKLPQSNQASLCPQIVNRDITAFNLPILSQTPLELLYLARVQRRWARCAKICYARYPIV